VVIAKKEIVLFASVEPKRISLILTLGVENILGIKLAVNA